MLVFFIHGVATRDAGYSKSLETLIRQEFDRQDKPLPIFYASFWGNNFNQTGQLWNWIRQDLKEFQKNHPQVNVKDVFRYQEFRQEFISEFFGDILTYFNTERGRDIRETIANQLQQSIRFHPQFKEIHFVTHSLGSVILWDVLLSERFTADDPAHKIRALLNLIENSVDYQGKRLRSITTMGSPILFFNLMLDVNPPNLWKFFSKYKQDSIRWINIIHSSDIIAYPLQASLDTKSIPNLFFRDKYIWADANGLERGARTMGQAHAAMAIGVADGHGYYWDSPGTARLVSANLLGDHSAIDSSIIDTR